MNSMRPLLRVTFAGHLFTLFRVEWQKENARFALTYLAAGASQTSANSATSEQLTNNVNFVNLTLQPSQLYMP